MNRFFSRNAFGVVLLVVFLLPFMTRGSRMAFQSNNNEVQDWLPPEYAETTTFNWFRQHFSKETFVLISWDGCTLEDDRLELLAQKLVPQSGPKPDSYFQRIDTGTRVFEQLTSPPLSLSEAEAHKRLEGLFIGPDHKQTCAVITLTDLGKRNLRKTLAALRGVTRDELGLPNERVRMGGPPVDSVAISTEGERTLKWLIGPAAIVGLVLAWWCLRSARLVTMVFATGLYAGAVSLSIVWYSGGTMNAILLTMPSVVYVAGISGAIHFANYYRDSATQEGVIGAPARALQHAWLPCMLSAFTTAAGLLSLYTSELVPIKFFGVYSALGVLATLLLLFVFLPSWMQVWPMRAHSLLDGSAPKAEDLALPARWRRFLEGVLARHRLVFCGLAAVMIFCGFGLTKINTTIKLMKMFSSDAPIVHDYAWLENKIGPLVPMEIIVRMDGSLRELSMLERMQLLERVQKGLRGIDGIGNTLSAVTFAPSLEMKGRGLLNRRVMANVVNKKIEDHRADYIHNGLLAVEDGVELWRISARVGALNDIDYGVFIDQIRERVEPILRVERERIVERRAARLAADSDVSSDSLVAQTASSEAPAGVPLAAGKAPIRIAGIQAEDAGLDAVYTGLVPLVYKAQRSMLNGLAWNFITDLATIALVMTVVFWDLSAGLILLIPSIFPVVVVFGLMGWLGVVIDVGTIITPTVALGVSVDDVVHFLIWYRRGLREGKGRHGAIMLAYEGCARAMYQSWSVLGLGLAVFSLSAFLPTQRFGAMMFTLLTAALVGNLILLPMILRSPLAMFFLRRIEREVEKEQEAQRRAAGKTGDGIPPSHLRRDKSKHRASA